MQWVAKWYGYILSFGSNLQSLFLLWMRLTWGHQFFLTGYGKLHNMPKVTEYFTSLGIQYPHSTAYSVGYIELMGGILLMVGFCSRLAGLILSIIMVSALSIAHSSMLSHFRFIYEPSSLVREAPYPFLITSLLVLVFGPGRISIDGWIKRWSEHQPKY